MTDKTGYLTRPWERFLEGSPENTATPGTSINPIIGFIINTGVTGTNVGPMLPAARSGTVSVCVVVVKASDTSTDLTFTINQNGTSVFTAPQTVPAATATGTLISITALTSVPLSVNYDDIFTINITSGSANWIFVAVLQTPPPSASANE